MTDEQTLRTVLAQSRQPWTVEAVLERVQTPANLKEKSPLCDRCDVPCRDNEVCITAIANDVDLLEKVGRDQAFHLLEGGVDRLRLKDTVDVRKSGETRPHTFVSQRE